MTGVQTCALPIYVDIPQWQIDKVLEAKSKVKDNPSSLIDWETVKQNIRNR